MLSENKGEKYEKFIHPTRGGGALGLNTREDALLGSQNCGALGSKGSKDADLGLENFGWASKTRHSETPQAGSESVNAHDLKPKLNAKDTLCIGALLHRQQIFDWKHHALVLISYVKNLRNRRFLLVPLRGFTLAEVLITLGIIGVVAALTIPTLISNNNKRIVETHLQEASSTLQQAYKMSLVDYGLNHEREGFTPNDADAALEMFNKYYVPYIKFNQVKKSANGVFGYLPNGSVLYFRKNGNLTDWGNTYCILCIKEKDCLEIDEETINTGVLSNGKGTFVFYTSGNVPTYAAKHKTRDQLLADCGSGAAGESCTWLIFDNGWKIPDDYPIKF